jgi:hypothetical protein
MDVEKQPILCLFFTYYSTNTQRLMQVQLPYNCKKKFKSRQYLQITLPGYLAIYLYCGSAGGKLGSVHRGADQQLCKKSPGTVSPGNIDTTLAISPGFYFNFWQKPATIRQENDDN